MIVFALDQWRTAKVANLDDARWIAYGMISGFAALLRTTPPSAQATDDFGVAHGQQYHTFEVQELLPQHLIERRGLRQRSRVAVHDKTFRAVVAAEAFGDEVVYQIVRNESARLDKRTRPLAARGLFTDGLPQKVARANVLKPVSPA